MESKWQLVSFATYEVSKHLKKANTKNAFEVLFFFVWPSLYVFAYSNSLSYLSSANLEGQ